MNKTLFIFNNWIRFKVDWKTANETCALRNMTLITIDSLEEQNRVLKFIENFYVEGFWTSVREQRTTMRIAGYIRQNLHTVSICKEFKRHPPNFTTYVINEANCSSRNYSFCFRKTKDESSDDDYECDCENVEEV